MSKFWLGFLVGLVSYRLVMVLLWSIVTITHMILSVVILAVVIGTAYWVRYKYRENAKERQRLKGIKDRSPKQGNR
jgi:heme/copper-type cytochrome/quinol oxidase subunit 2